MTICEKCYASLNVKNKEHIESIEDEKKLNVQTAYAVEIK